MKKDSSLFSFFFFFFSFFFYFSSSCSSCSSSSWFFALRCFPPKVTWFMEPDVSTAKTTQQARAGTGGNSEVEDAGTWARARARCSFSA